MHRKLKNEEKSLAAEIDAGIKDKWNFSWLDASIKTTVCLANGLKKEVVLRVGDSISKVNVAGQACCDFCQDTLSTAQEGEVT